MWMIRILPDAMNRTMCLLSNELEWTISPFKDFISHSPSRGSIYYISRILQGAGCVSDHGGLRRPEAIKCHFWSLLNEYLRQQFITLASKFMFSRDYFLGGLRPMRKIKYIHVNGGK